MCLTKVVFRLLAVLGVCVVARFSGQGGNPYSCTYHPGSTTLCLATYFTALAFCVLSMFVGGLVGGLIFAGP